MAKKKKNVEETTEQVKDTSTKETKKSNVTKVKMKKSTIDDNIIKVDLSKPPPIKDKEVEEKPVEEKVTVVNEEPKVEEQKEEKVKEEQLGVKEEQQKEEVPVIQEVTNEDIANIEEEVTDAIIESEETGEPLPENIQKLMSFMDETGGDLVDYVNLNRDISKMDNSEVLDEYYRTTKSHLTPEERNFLLEDTFGYDEEVDDTKEVRKKKIALKEQVAEAKAYLDGQKSKYYEDIKAGSKLTPEQKKAIDFFNRHNKESEKQKKISEANKRTFLKKTDNVFNKNFKGFDYEVGDKKFRFNVKDINKVKETQSDLNNFVNEFIDEDNVNIKDAEGYHKSLFTAMNADAIAKHFYEQGKADAVKDQIAKDKNVNMNPRRTHGEIEAGGMKVRILGESSDDMRNRSFKVRKKN